MSAFLCTDNHINAMLTFYADHCGEPFSQVALDLDAARLLRQNYRSLAARYGDTDAPHEIRFKRVGVGLPGTPLHTQLAVSLPPVAILKLCMSYNYQACETEDYDTTEAAAIVRRIIGCAIRELPGYNDAKWSL